MTAQALEELKTFCGLQHATPQETLCRELSNLKVFLLFFHFHPNAG